MVGEGEPADFVVVNTCTVTADAESASRQAIRRLAREHPAARIVAAGCYAQVAPDSLARLPGVRWPASGRWASATSHQSGKDLEVVVERVQGGIASGTARQYVTVRWPLVGERRGGLAQVRVEASDGEGCFGVRSAAFHGRLPP